MFLSLKEFSTPNAWVFICILIDLNCIISAEERKYEFTIIFISIFRNKSSFEPHNILIVGEQFDHIFFGRFGLKTKDAS